MSVTKKSNALVYVLIVFVIGGTVGGFFLGQMSGQPARVTSGTLRIGGSTTVFPIVKDAAERFSKLYPGLIITIDEVGSSHGVAGTINKTYALGMSSKTNGWDVSGGDGFNKSHVCYDGIAIATHPGVVDSNSRALNLTYKQIRGIYAGWITNWKNATAELNGPDMNIVVVGRTSGSGTRDTFDSKALGSTTFTYVSTAVLKGENSEVQSTVQNTVGAIGYVGLGYLSGLNTVSVSSKTDVYTASSYSLPTEDTVRALTYPVARKLWLLYLPETVADYTIAYKFVEFLVSSMGQESVRAAGYVTLYAKQ